LLDGYVGGLDQSKENPLGLGGMELHEWFFPLREFREMRGEDGGARISVAITGASRNRSPM
jgi:hypothetical protein